MGKIKNLLNRKISKYEFNYRWLKFWQWNWGKIKEFLKVFLIASSVIFVIILIIDIIQTDFLTTDDENDELAYEISDYIIGYLDEYYIMPKDNLGNCNVAGIELHGQLVTYVASTGGGATDTAGMEYDMVASEELVGMIRDAEDDPSIKAILLEVDSYGGSPVAAEEVASALKLAKKPSVAYIRDAGISAAYWAASAADYIISSANSDIGSIGVTMSYLDYVAQNKTEGLNYNQLSTGKYKDMFDPNKQLTAEERTLAMRDLNMIRENFIKAVAVNRNLDQAKVNELADGSTLPGMLALENGLVDRLGNYGEVRDHLKELVGEEAEICWY